MTGVTNSRSRDKFVAWGVSGYGVDTLALAFRGPTIGPVLDHLSEMRGAGKLRPGKGGAYVAPAGAAPATLAWYPADGLLVVEGRLAPIFTGDRQRTELWPVSDLPYSREAAWEMWRDYLGAPQTGTPDDCRVARVDLTSEVEFDQGGGLPFLAALGSLDPPRYKVDVWRSKGRTETVYLRTPKRGIVHLRAYDKGIETGQESPGKRIRLERQARFRRPDQMTPETFSERDAHNLHHGGLSPFAVAGRGIEVGGPVEVANRLLDLWRTGVIPQHKCKRLIGHVYFTSLAAPVTAAEVRSDQRHAKELRDLGLAVADWEVPDTIPVGDVLAELGRCFAAC